MWYWIIFGIVFFATFAMTVREGLWSNTILLFNLLISGVVAFACYAPLVLTLDEKLSGEYTYVLDFVCIWALFVVSMILLSSLTVMASRTRMRFRHPIDPVGGPAVGLIAAWSLAAMVLATLHAAPMPGREAAFGGALAYGPGEVESASSFSSPDIGWLRFVENVTQPTALGHSDKKGFSASAFVTIYGKHREQFSKAPGLRVRRG
jgi:uncharacterized membrane protein required for colicin V production